SEVRVSVAMAMRTPRVRGSFPRSRGVTQLTASSGGRALAGRQHPHDAILRGRLPRGGVGRALLTAADVLDLVRSPVGAGEPDERDAAAVGVSDLLAELRGGRGDLAGDAAAAQRASDGVAEVALLLIGDGHQHAGG